MNRKSLLGLVLFSVLVVGCTESSSPIGGTVSPTSNTSQSGGVDANGILSGEIWVTDVFGTDRINLRTGRSIEVSEERAYPSRDGRVFVEHLEDVARVDNEFCSISFDELEEINVKNSITGELLSSFRLNRDINGPVRMSPDRERIAMFVAEDSRDCGSNSFNPEFSIFSKDGVELYRDSIEDSVQGYDFHPDGRLVILRHFGGNEYKIQIEPTPGFNDFVTLLSFFSAPDVLFYRGLRVGPTGNDVVVEEVLGIPPVLAGITYRDARAHHFPLFDNGRPLPEGVSFGSTALFVYPGEARVNSPAFSPDGRHIMVTEGFSSGSAVFFQQFPNLDQIDATLIVPFNADNLSYVVPVNVKEQLMPPLEYSDTIFPVLINQSGTVSSAGFKPITGFSWVPAID